MKVANTLLGVLTVLSVACGPKAPPKVATPTPKPVVSKDVREPVVQHTCGNRQKIAQLFGEAAHNPTEPAPSTEPVSEAPPPSTGEQAPGTTPMRGGTQAYRIVAPATVLIRSGDGFGTGVIIDPRGYVLTNHHVIADGRKKDFIVSVDVSFGDLTSTGRMAKREKTYEAVVVKDDPVRDLALIKVIDAPKTLPTVKLAKSAPQIAERVMAIGHAGIGFLWAAKSCGVASIGEHQHDTSMLAGFDCSRPDPTQSADAAKREKEVCDAQKKRLTEAFMAETQGLAVQTDCAITHGDSGGPLVNSAGELVGLNQSLSVDGATVSFHVHLDEIRDFAAKFEEEPIPVVPDPYCDGGLDASLEDIDLDGKPDTLVTKGYFGGFFGGMDRMSLLIDLDQSHKAGKEGFDAFDVDIALLKLRDGTYVWYDTDKDNRFDVMLVDKDDDGEPEKAYHIDEKGRLKEDKEILPKHDLSAKFIKDASLHARLGKIAEAIGGQRYTSRRVRTAAEAAITVPDGLLGGGSTGRAVDSDGDGKSDSVFVRGAFSRGVLIDANQDSLSSVKPGDVADDLVKAKKIDAEVSVITQGDRLWALYDTDNDSTFDLALLSPAPGYGDNGVFAASAWKIGSKGEMTPAPEHIGRKLFRPQLVGMPRVASALKLAGMDVAADDGLGSLPNPMEMGPRTTFRFREMKGLPKNAVLDVQTGTTSVILVDVDGNSKVGPKDEPRKLVAEKKFDAEIAIVQRDGKAWVFYDTDNDNKFDLVLFAAQAAKGPSQAFRVTNGGAALETDDKMVTGRLFRHKTVFKDKTLGPKWKALATKLFSPSTVEE